MTKNAQRPASGLPGDRAPCQRVAVLTRTWWRRAAVLASLVLFGTCLTSLATHAEEGPWPGLPYIGYDPDRPGSLYAEYGWLGAAQVGISGSSRSKQWAKVPLTMLALNSTFYQPPDEPGVNSDFIVDSYAFLVSPDASRHNYGDSALIPVHTVAFGAIPVRATLQLSQRRDANDLPVPFHFVAENETIENPDGSNAYSHYLPARLRDQVTVRLVDLEVDGVSIDLARGCSTGPRAELDISSDYWRNPPGQDEIDVYDPAKAYAVALGGTLHGTIDIPEFSGCRTATGDDLSPVVTAMLAGPDNPVRVQIGGASCKTLDMETYKPLPPGPGDDTPAEAECPPDPYPERNPKMVIVPDPLPFPKHAP